jgi:hypothetical protein
MAAYSFQPSDRRLLSQSITGKARRWKGEAQQSECTTVTSLVGISIRPFFKVVELVLLPLQCLTRRQSASRGLKRTGGHSLGPVSLSIAGAGKEATCGRLCLDITMGAHCDHSSLS